MVSRNLYEQQSANKHKTVAVMALFALFVGFIGWGFDVYFFHFGDGGLPIPIATIAAICFGGWSAMWGLESGASTILSSSDAIPVEDNDPKYQVLRDVTEEMAIASGLPKPRLYIIPDPDPNAFATGKDPEHACIAVTEGLLEKLDREELQGVIAHEMGHVRNYDIRMMTVVAALIGAVMLLSEVGLRSGGFGIGRRRSSSSRNSGGGVILLVLWIVAMILAPLVAQILAMAVSRQREYLADASGAELTRNPNALASALEKIDNAVEPTRSIKKGTGNLCIADPLGRNINGKEGFFAELFGTHPPISKRIMLLHAMSYRQT
ncbi:MAG TPA: M48 family metalloprotease [Bacteroidota bacterium]|nr:M48 family metalloprotease [Bacteroidota bacterium]